MKFKSAIIAISLGLTALCAHSAQAQSNADGITGASPSSEATEQPEIAWRGTARMTSDTEGVVTLTATMADGWHLYGLKMPDKGPKPTKFTFTTTPGFVLVGNVASDCASKHKHDAMFDADVTYWEGKVSFTQHFKLDKTAGTVTSISCAVNYMGCNDETCMPPKTKNFKLKILPVKSSKKN
jgi:thiol:disulfide interchange protein DsbD